MDRKMGGERERGYAFRGLNEARREGLSSDTGYWQCSCLGCEVKCSNNELGRSNSIGCSIVKIMVNCALMSVSAFLIYWFIFTSHHGAHADTNKCKYC